MKQRSLVFTLCILLTAFRLSLSFSSIHPKIRTVQSTPTCTSLHMSKVYAPSRSIVYNDQKYRLCAAAAVLNSQGHLLVGERTSIPDAWQAPQGGVDGAWEENNFQEETVAQAASRELYEEMGLIVGKDVVLEAMDFGGIRYETNGTTNWLTKAGFAGQELHWVLFRCIDGRGDADASVICDLTGQNGEAPEFTRVVWRSIQRVIQEMWPAKRGPYQALESILETSHSKWMKQCAQADFAGTWSRDNSLSQDVQEAFVARGMTNEKAKQSANDPYKQTWSPAEKDLEWTVVTYADDGKTPRRTLVYSTGEWEETYKGRSTLFGDSAEDRPAMLKRRTFYAPEPIAKGEAAVAHVTISKTPKGDLEESRRYRDGELFVLKRTFWSKADPNNGVVSKEFFRKDEA